MILASFNSLENLQHAVTDLADMPIRPVLVEIVDGNLLKQVNDANPNLLKGIVDAKSVRVLLIEFDDNANA